MTYDLAVEALAARIPSHWRTLPFRRVATLSESVNSKSTATLLSLASTGVVAPREEFGGLGRQMPAEGTIERYWLASPGNLVVNPMWLVGGGIGVSNVHGAVSPDYRVYRLGPELDPRFIHHLLRSQPYRDQYKLYTRAETTFDRRVSKVDFHAMPILVPTLDEQRRIADFLDAETARIDRMVELRSASRTLIEEKAFASIAKLSTIGSGAVQSTNDPWIPQIGAGWKVLPLKRRWRIIDCKHRTPTYIDSGYPVISPGDITAGRLDLFKAHRFVDEVDYRDLADTLRRARRGDIVYSRNASIGIAAYVDTDEKFTMGQDVCRITSTEQDQLFLTYFLNTAALAQLGSLQIGSTFTRVNIGTLLELSVACPPREEQSRLATAMDLISRDTARLTSALDDQITLLAERRQALITAAVTGGITI